MLNCCPQFIQTKSVIAALLINSGKILVFKSKNSMGQYDCSFSQGHIFICGYFFSITESLRYP